MKVLYSILCLVFMIFIGKVANAQTDEQLLQVFQQHTQLWKEAYNSGDAKNLIPLYTEEASYISSHVEGLEANGRDRLIANFQQGINMGGHIDSVEILSMNVSCDMATLFCKYKANNNGSIAIGRNLLVLKKMDGKWLIVLHMTVV